MSSDNGNKYGNYGNGNVINIVDRNSRMPTNIQSNIQPALGETGSSYDGGRNNIAKTGGSHVGMQANVQSLNYPTGSQIATSSAATTSGLGLHSGRNHPCSSGAESAAFQNVEGHQGFVHPSTAMASSVGEPHYQSNTINPCSALYGHYTNTTRGEEPRTNTETEPKIPRLFSYDAMENVERSPTKVQGVLSAVKKFLKSSVEVKSANLEYDNALKAMEEARQVLEEAKRKVLLAETIAKKDLDELFKEYNAQPY